MLNLSALAAGEAKATSAPEMRVGTHEDGREGLFIFVPLPSDPPRTKDGSGPSLMLGTTSGFQNVPGTASRVNLTWTVKAPTGTK